MSRGKRRLQTPSEIPPQPAQPGRLAVYDLASMRERDQFTFAARVSYATFVGNGARLVVLTEDQALYVLDVSTAKGAPDSN